MKKIPLSQGYTALVDDEDYEELNKHKWCANGNGNRNRIYYAERGDYSSPKRKTIRMHRVVTGARKGQEVDHINGNTFDNRRENLRLCNHRGNTRNRRPQKHKRFKGTFPRKAITRARGGKPWSARIWVDEKQKTLGVFITEEEAARAYDVAAKRHFGEFAWLNFPREGNNG